MAANTQPYEIIAGPADVYFAPVGTAFPAVDATPGSVWTKMGYTEGGVKVGHPQTIVELRADQVTAPIKAVRSEESLEITYDLATMSLENYALALNQAISGPSASAVKLYRGGSHVEVFALLVRGEGLSPEGPGNLQYKVPVVFQAGNPEVAYVKDNKSVLAISLHAIADPNRGDDSEAFGELEDDPS